MPCADDPSNPRPAPTTLDCTSAPTSWADDDAADADGDDGVGGGGGGAAPPALPADGNSSDGALVTVGHDLAESQRRPERVAAAEVVLPVVGVPMERLAAQ